MQRFEKLRQAMPPLLFRPVDVEPSQRRIVTAAVGHGGIASSYLPWWRRSILYVYTCIELWVGNCTDPKLSRSKR